MRGWNGGMQFRAATILLALLAVRVDAEVHFTHANWAIEAQFPGEPKTDGILTPSPMGDVRVQRFYCEPGAEHYLVARFEYPLAVGAGEEAALYERTIADLLRVRPGVVRERGAFELGSYRGERVVIAQSREANLREVRLVVIGAVLYLASAEWPEHGAGAARANGFLQGLALRPDCVDPRAVTERGRWREISVGRFRLRYDATAWYRDPADGDSGVYNLLRSDGRAEAQFIAEPRPLADGVTIEAFVVQAAREAAQQVAVTRSTRRHQGGIDWVELEFDAEVDRTAYHNHGCFYSGPEGTAQLRGWTPRERFTHGAPEIARLLEGLAVVPDQPGALVESAR